MADEAPKKAPIIHTTPLFGGKMTAEEVWIAALNRPCFACKRPGVTLFRTLLRWKDLVAKRPDIAGAILARSEDGCTAPLIPTIYGPMVCVAEVVSCTRCTPSCEKSAAKGEAQYSAQGLHCLVEIRRGPGPDPVVVPVS